MFEHIRRLWKRLTGQERPASPKQQPFWAIGPNDPQGRLRDISIDQTFKEQDE
jgi:hypothetical protein